MPSFSFDDSKGVDENLELFFDHMATHHSEFASYLRAYPNTEPEGRKHS
jgi:hypothetical protein